jgi:hypothetical protein
MHFANLQMSGKPEAQALLRWCWPICRLLLDACHVCSLQTGLHCAGAQCDHLLCSLRAVVPSIQA